MSMMDRRDGFRRRPAARHGALRHGMTLIEVLVVIAIIGVLVSILMPVLTRVRQTGKESETKALMTHIANAITTMRDQYNFEDLLVLDQGLTVDPDLGVIAPQVNETGANDITGSFLLEPDPGWFNICRELDPPDITTIGSPIHPYWPNYDPVINKRRYRNPPPGTNPERSQVFIHYHDSNVKLVNGEFEVVDAWDRPIRYAARRFVKDMDGVAPDDFVYQEFLISGGQSGIASPFNEVQADDIVMPLKEFTYYQDPP